ncbi:MAG: MotA/TolQ/ExbB proton channel family protein [Gammaproteobacteria bacterium]|nr:MotA/TolQ/ExbB proton channel family protein [Gammaproteobacteria bacterium]MBI5617280.1 MotA/TolQ/ExbB proton channel family protein [Gammaproteobacteria bacterium]
MTQPKHLPLLLWFCLFGLVVFGAVVCVDQGLVQAMVEADQSRICIVLIVMYGIGLGHTFRRTLYLSREIDRADALTAALATRGEEPISVQGRGLATPGGALPAGLVAEYLADLYAAHPRALAANEAGEAGSELLEAYASKLRSANDFGWFYIDVMLKVGFLGTLVGFILMLGSIADTATLDATTMQKVLKQMSIGMSTALYTTLASLVGGILLGIPYQLLERALDRLVETAIYIKEVQVMPRLAAGRPAA